MQNGATDVGTRSAFLTSDEVLLLSLFGLLALNRHCIHYGPLCAREVECDAGLTAQRARRRPRSFSRPSG